MDTPARLLRLLTMFSTRASWNADDLAGRLEITTRTLRRDVTRLRDLGYPITSTTGRYGGYELGAGGRLPPLMLDDDEAIAVSVALRDSSAEADPTLGEAALSASTKLRQVLPRPLRDRVDALGEMVVGVRRTRARGRGRRARRAAESDDVGDVLPARRARALHLPRAMTASANGVSNRTGSCRSGGVGTWSGSTSIATTGARIASTASASSPARVTATRRARRRTRRHSCPRGSPFGCSTSSARVRCGAGARGVDWIGPTVGVVEPSMTRRAW